MKTEELEKHSLVRVVWVDSNYTQGWQHDRDKTVCVPKIVSVGYVTAATEEAVEVAGSLGADDGDKLNPLSIPLVSVVEIERLGALKEQGEKNVAD